MILNHQSGKENYMIFEKLRNIICEQLEINPDEITMDTNIMRDYDADSLDLVDIVMSIEDEFGVEIPEDSMEDLAVMRAAVEYIESHME